MACCKLIVKTFYPQACCKLFQQLAAMASLQISRSSCTCKHRRPKNVAINFVHCKRRRQRIVYIYSIHTYSIHVYYIHTYIHIVYMYTIYVNNMLPPALAVHEIYRDIFGPPMMQAKSRYYKERQVDRKKCQAIRW